MQVRNENPTVLSTEIRVIPQWMWPLAIIGFIAMQFVFNVVVARQADAPPAWARALLGILTGIVLASYLLFVGYVNRDSRRRGMSPVLWTLIAFLIPNALGIILYFVLRQPLRSVCPRCGTAVQNEFNFCPQCNCKLAPNCPQCQHAISLTDAYCPYCGASVRDQHVAMSQPASEHRG